MKQISVFLQNKSGRLNNLTATLNEAGINLRALSIAETADFGIARLIVDKTADAMTVLKENNFLVKETDVVAVAIPDEVGGLNKILTIFQENETNLEYMYAFLGKETDGAVMVCRVDNHEITKEVLRKAGIKVLDETAI